MPKHKPSTVIPARQRGAALAIGLILLLILTLLAFTSVNTSVTELAMAGNEQYRKNASQAAAAGIEQSIALLNTVGTSPGAAAVVTAGELVPGSNVDEFSTTARYVGEETNLPQSSADKFIGLHFSIDSAGTSARNANDRQVQGVMVVSSADSGGGSLGQLGSGLGP